MIQAIGFDLFNTLITVDPETMEEANNRLIQNLKRNGFNVETQYFRQAHREAAMRFLALCRKNGKETHNRFWISAALETENYHISPDDARIAEAVEAYFSAFYIHCNLIPGTKEMLETLHSVYRLGLLSNFTHGPAARKIIDLLGLNFYFDAVLISGEIGYRKPHPLVFQELIHHLKVRPEQALYVGDDIEPDIEGALQAGLQPVWTSYVRDHGLASTVGVIAKGNGVPDTQVPRITDWGDLLFLLKGL